MNTLAQLQEIIGEKKQSETGVITAVFDNKVTVATRNGGAEFVVAGGFKEGDTVRIDTATGELKKIEQGNVAVFWV